MDNSFSPLERAFHIARYGDARSVSELRAILKRERYSVTTIEGPSLIKQLASLIRVRLASEAERTSESAKL